MLLHIG